MIGLDVVGVIGPGGRGTAHSFGLADQVDLIGGTFSKSMASIGGWLVGERKVLDYIKHFAPSFMFAASAAPPSVAAAMAVGQLIGGYLGARTGIRFGARIIRPIVIVVSVALALKLLFFR